MVKARAHYFFVNPDEEKIRLGLKHFPGYENTGFYHICNQKPTTENARRLGIKPSMDVDFVPLDFYYYKGSLLKLFEIFYRKKDERELMVNVSGAPVSVGCAAATALHLIGVSPFEYAESERPTISPILPRIEKSLEFSDMERDVLKALKTIQEAKPMQIVKIKSRAETQRIIPHIRNLKELGLVKQDENDLNRYSLTERGELAAELIEIRDRLEREKN